MGVVRGEHHLDEQCYVWRVGAIDPDGIGGGHDHCGIGAVRFTNTEHVVYYKQISAVNDGPFAEAIREMSCFPAGLHEEGGVTSAHGRE